MVFRLDKLAITVTPKAVKLDNGWLRAPATLTRVGVFDYAGPNGTVRRELRLPEEVFKADALSSFDLVPLTDDHPGELDSKNTHTYSVGSVGKVHADTAEGLVRAELLVTDGNAVTKIESGKQELSCGYFADLDMTPGVWTDPRTGRAERYDCVQRNIRGNHVALVSKGRAGPEARVRLDSADFAVLVSDSSHNNASGVDIPPAKETPQVKITIDGVEVEVSDLAAQLIGKERKTHADMLSAVQAEAKTAKADGEKHAARADAAEAQVTKLNDEIKTLPEKMKADAAARSQLEGQAREVLGKDQKFDGKSDDEIRKLVITKLDAAAKLEGKSPEYVAARFDSAIAFAVKGNPATSEAAARISAGTKTEGTPAPHADAADRAAAYDKAVRNAWQSKVESK
jgi:hypothetical protein